MKKAISNSRRRRCKVTGRLKLEHTIFGDAFTYLKSVTKGTPKLTIPSPSMMHYRGGRAAIDEKVYPDLEVVLGRTSRRLCRRNRRAVRNSAARICSSMTPSLAYLNDPTQREHLRKLGGDSEHQHEIYIKLINGALAKANPRT